MHVTKTPQPKARQAKPAHARATIGAGKTNDASESTKATPARSPWPQAGKWCAADLKQECRAILESSMRVTFADVEAAARELLEDYTQEVAADNQIRNAAAALDTALAEVERLAGEYPHSKIASIAKAFAEPRGATKEALGRLAWKPKRERAKPLTVFVEALDRTNFLAVIDRPATDKEFAALFLALGEAPDLTRAQLAISMRVAFKQIVDAIAKNRRENGRPAFIDRAKKSMAPRLPGVRVRYL